MPVLFGLHWPETQLGSELNRWAVRDLTVSKVSSPDGAAALEAADDDPEASDDELPQAATPLKVAPRTGRASTAKIRFRKITREKRRGRPSSGILMRNVTDTPILLRQILTPARSARLRAAVATSAVRSTPLMDPIRTTTVSESPCIQSWVGNVGFSAAIS